MMFVIRPIKHSDTKNFIDLVLMMQAGITSLPKDIDILQNKIKKSIEAFTEDRWAPENETYLFVLENIDTKHLGGICGIYSKTGIDTPVYHYDIQEEQIHNGAVKIPSQKMLVVTSYRQGPTENCSLFLHPRHRRDGLGKLLSFSRFLFMASNRKRFDDIIIANLRGVFKRNGKSLFWEEIGRHFLDVEYDTLQNKILEEPELISAILPKYPIYVSLLSKEVQAVIGQPHTRSVPALQMLLNEGFKLTNKIDPFDGGPSAEAFIDQIHFIKHSNVAEVSALKSEKKETEKVIVCNNKADFRATYARISPSMDGRVTISRKVARALEINVGESIRFSSLKGGGSNG
jgi:arginine N-succinyltransferase